MHRPSRLIGLVVLATVWSACGMGQRDLSPDCEPRPTPAELPDTEEELFGVWGYDETGLWMELRPDGVMKIMWFTGGEAGDLFYVFDGEWSFDGETISASYTNSSVFDDVVPANDLKSAEMTLTGIRETDSIDVDVVKPEQTLFPHNVMFPEKCEWKQPTEGSLD